MTKQGQAAIELHAIPILVLVKNKYQHRESFHVLETFCRSGKTLTFTYIDIVRP